MARTPVPRSCELPAAEVEGSSYHVMPWCGANSLAGKSELLFSQETRRNPICSHLHFTQSVPEGLSAERQLLSVELLSLLNSCPGLTVPHCSLLPAPFSHSTSPPAPTSPSSGT